MNTHLILARGPQQQFCPSDRIKTEQTLSNNKLARTSHIKVGHTGEHRAFPEMAVTEPPQQLGGGEGGKETGGETGTSSRPLRADSGSWDPQVASEASFGLTGGMTPVQLRCKGRASFSKRSPTGESLCCFLLFDAYSKPAGPCTQLVNSHPRPTVPACSEAASGHWGLWLTQPPASETH